MAESDRGAVRRARARAKGEAEEWLARLGRLGFAAKGLVYLVIGLVAIRAAFGSGGDTAGPQGALVELARQPLGRTLLWVVALGLVGYMLWRFVQAWRDTEDQGSDAKGLVVRAAYGVSGLIHGGLALAAVSIARGGGGDGDGQEQDLVARVLEQPAGRWLVMLGGAITVAVGLFQFREAWTARFRDCLRRERMSAREERGVLRVGQVGHVARGIVFAIAGAFVVLAGWRADPGDAKGLAEALGWFEEQPFGPWLLGLMGLGLCAYALFQFVLVRYHRMVRY